MEPESFEAAQKQEVWRKAMEEEIKMIEKNETWELVDPPRQRHYRSQVGLQDKAQPRRLDSKA